MSAETPDYRTTVFLPETNFPMRAGLPQREPGWLARWQRIGVYDRLRDKAAAAAAAGQPRTPFTLHDGPPYANGHLHIGHALNKILKDFIVRSQQMLGRDARYVPGWDCHGLPIEWKIEEQYRARGLNKDDVDVVAFRQECRRFAEGWVEIQRAEFQRLGVTGNWADPYLTMDYRAEAVIADEFLKFLMNGTLYQGSKPVLWSPVEKTALAEAEVEYHDHTSHQVWVRFPVVAGDAVFTATRTDVLIWTTTPWTIPQNRAVAYNPAVAYGLYEIVGRPEDSTMTIGHRLILADALAEADAEKPALLLDAATLTGAARVAVGPDLPALFSPDDGLADAMLKAGLAAADPLWRLPLHTPYRDYLDSKVADINNAGDTPFGGAITAALFLKEFVTETRAYAHLDTFGWSPRPRPGRPVGGEATGLRALFRFIEDRFGKR